MLSALKGVKLLTEIKSSIEGLVVKGKAMAETI
jgi:hypothetical protein